MLSAPFLENVNCRYEKCRCWLGRTSVVILGDTRLFTLKLGLVQYYYFLFIAVNKKGLFPTVYPYNYCRTMSECGSQYLTSMTAMLPHSRWKIV